MMRGFSEGTRHYGLLLDHLEIAIINRFLYMAPRPVGAPKSAKGTPPRLVFEILRRVHPAIRQRVKRAERGAARPRVAQPTSSGGTADVKPTLAAEARALLSDDLRLAVRRAARCPSAAGVRVRAHGELLSPSLQLLLDGPARRFPGARHRLDGTAGGRAAPHHEGAVARFGRRDGGARGTAVRDSGRQRGPGAPDLARPQRRRRHGRPRGAPGSGGRRDARLHGGRRPARARRLRHRGPPRPRTSRADRQDHPHRRDHRHGVAPGRRGRRAAEDSRACPGGASRAVRRICCAKPR